MMDIDWLTVTKLQPPLTTKSDKRDFLQLIKVYIDDFIGVIQSTNKYHLRQFSRRILDGITKVSPPPALSGSKMAHPVSEKKLIEDGIWDTRKEILGWQFDGMALTIKLPQRKCEELLLELKAVRRLTPRPPPIRHHRHTVRKTYPRPTKLIHVFCCKKQGPQPHRHKRPPSNSSRLVSPHLPCRKMTNPRRRTHRTPPILSRVCGCVEMGSRRCMVQRHKTAHPHRVVLREAPGHERPILFLY
jgi:hypothetical protein